MKVLPSVLAFAALAAAQDTISIRGSVVDRDTHAPIPGAQVSLRSPLAAGASIVADGAGGFEFQVQTGAPWAISASAPGYETASRGVTPGQSPIQIELSRVGGVRGRLIDDETAKPLAGLRVEVVTRDSLEPANRVGRAARGVNSFPDGSFLFDDLFPANTFCESPAPPRPRSN